MSAGNKPALKPKPGKVKVFQAICSYEKKLNDELSFKEGDYIYVFEQTSDGWWRAKCNGKTGVIPCTYVTEKDEMKQPLHDAARRGNLSFVQELLSQGVSHTGLDAMFNTALYWAAASGHMDCLELLLSLPTPPINAQNHCGDTCLHIASARGHIKAVEMLLAHLADATIKNSNGETAEDLAKDMAVKNLLHMSRPSRNSGSRIASYVAEDYEDDSDT